MVPVEWAADLGGGNPQPRVVAIGPPSQWAVPSLAASDVALPTAGSRWRPRTCNRSAAAGRGWRLSAAVSATNAAQQAFHRPLHAHFPDLQIGPVLCLPVGNEIVFSWFGYEKEYQFDLYIKQVGQEHVVQLTHHPAVFLDRPGRPTADSSAFMRQAEPDARGIYSSFPAGELSAKWPAPLPLWKLGTTMRSWSPDGKWLAFSKGNSLAKKAGSSADHFSIHLVNVETSEERLLPDPSNDCGNTWQPAFSPDVGSISPWFVCLPRASPGPTYKPLMESKHAK